MINNYVEYQYQPCHLIHSFDEEQRLNLFLGDVSSALDLEFIHNSNIKTVVTAAAGMDQVVYQPEEEIKHIVYAVLDHKNQNLIKFFDQFFQLVEKQIKVGSILVHCAAGISRSSTLVISYLMKKFNWPFKEAIKYVRKSRPTVLPNLGFERQLKQYQKIIVQQQNRRLKSKTSQSNKHASQSNKSQLFPQIGILGVSSTKNKILQAFRIYRRDEEQQKLHKKNIFNNHQGLKNDLRLNSLKYQHFQKFKPLSRQLGQTKSVSLQQGLERNLRQYEEGGKLSSYIDVKTDNYSDVVSSRKNLASRNGLFDSAIIPIKYNTVNKPGDTLKKTNIKFSQVNTNSLTINRINIFKQKYSRNNQPLSLQKPDRGDQNENFMILKNDIEVNLGQLKTKQNFTIKLSKVKYSPNEIMTNLMSGKNTGGYLKKERLQNRKESQMKNRDEVGQDQGPKKVTIKNLLFSQI